MPYPEELVRPMREELTSAGVKELRTAADVDAFMADKNGTAMLIVNSVCGCAAGGARPGVRLALKSGKKPDRVATVFAGNRVVTHGAIVPKVGLQTIRLANYAQFLPKGTRLSVTFGPSSGSADVAYLGASALSL